jgi:hypothetical protein
MRLYTPLVTLSVVAVLASVGACERRHREEVQTLHVVPPPDALARADLLGPPALRPAPPPGAPRPTPPVGDDAPSAEEAADFQRPVQK